MKVYISENEYFPVFEIHDGQVSWDDRVEIEFTEAQKKRYERVTREWVALQAELKTAYRDAYWDNRAHMNVVGWWSGLTRLVANQLRVVRRAASSNLAPTVESKDSGLRRSGRPLGRDTESKTVLLNDAQGGTASQVPRNAKGQTNSVRPFARMMPATPQGPLGLAGEVTRSAPSAPARALPDSQIVSLGG